MLMAVNDLGYPWHGVMVLPNYSLHLILGAIIQTWGEQAIKRRFKLVAEAQQLQSPRLGAKPNCYTIRPESTGIAEYRQRFNA